MLNSLVEQSFVSSVLIKPATSSMEASEPRTLVLSPEDLQAIISGVASSSVLISGIAEHLHSRNLLPVPPPPPRQPSEQIPSNAGGSAHHVLLPPALRTPQVPSKHLNYPAGNLTL